MRRLLCLVVAAAPAAAPAIVAAQVSDPSVVLSTSSLAPPPAGGTATDPTFGVTVRRLTDRGENGGLGTAEYPQLQAVNADETRVLVSTEAGFQVMDLATGQVTHQGIALALPRWHPVEADTLIGFDRRSGDVRFQHVELMGGGVAMTRDVVNVGALGFRGLTQGSWEDASADGRYIPIHNQRNGADQAAVIDTVTQQVAVEIETGGVDWVGVSASGAYMTVQHNSRGTGPRNGLVVYDVATGARLGHATDHGEHGDLGVDAQGRDVFGTVAWTDLCANGEAPCFTVSVLPDAVENGQHHNRRVFDPPVGNYTSCRATQRGGFCLSSDDYGRGGRHPFSGELWLNRMSDGAVRRLFHHRSSSGSYYTLVRPTLSPSGRYALFTSDWARPNSADQGDLYVIDLSPFLEDFLDEPPPPPVDGGVSPDANLSPDSGVPPIDGGAPPDGGLVVRDSGVHRDAGAPADGGGGGGPVDRGPRGTTGGCVCATPAADGPGWPGVALAALLGLGLGSRRRR